MSSNKKINWTTWSYENNAPFTLFKMGFNHALSIVISIFLISFIYSLFKFNTIEQILYFWGLILFSEMVLMLCSVIFFTMSHTIHYLLFKKILLYNKLEYSILIAWFLVFTHYQLICYGLDYVLDTLKYNLSVIEAVFLFIGYMVGMLISFRTFQNNFYINNVNKLGDDNLWKTVIDPEQKYFG